MQSFFCTVDLKFLAVMVIFENGYFQLKGSMYCK